MTEDEENVPVATLGLSGAFDSMAATLRLAAMTNDEAEVEELSRTLRMSRPEMGELKPPVAPVRPKPITPPPMPTPVRTPGAALEDSEGDEEETGGSGNLLLIAIIVLVVVGVVLFVLF